MSTKYMKTGEQGFCPKCGTVADVVVLPDDRLQARIGKTAWKNKRRNGLSRREFCDYESIYLRAFADQVMDKSQMILPEIDGYSPDYRLIWYSMIKMQISLVYMAEAIQEILNEPCDLMRAAAEMAEKEVEG